MIKWLHKYYVITVLRPSELLKPDRQRHVKHNTVANPFEQLHGLSSTEILEQC
jgi:hypothetical protein